jgi:hypothetical protein
MLMPRKLFGSLGSPRLKTGTITAIDHASGNSPEIKIPLNSLPKLFYGKFAKKRRITPKVSGNEL